MIESLDLTGPTVSKTKFHGLLRGMLRFSLGQGITALKACSVFELRIFSCREQNSHWKARQVFSQQKHSLNVVLWQNVSSKGPIIFKSYIMG